MNLLLVGLATVLGVAFGWYGRKASARIEAWGRNMDEYDRIFQIAGGEMPDGWDNAIEDSQPAPPFSGQLHVGPVGNK